MCVCIKTTQYRIIWEISGAFNLFSLYVCIYVLYMYMTSLENPAEVIATPPGYVLAPIEEERVGDVSNVLFANGWIADDDGTVYLYYASSDTRMHVATSTLERLVDYCMNSGNDGLTSETSVRRLKAIIDANAPFITEEDR